MLEVVVRENPSAIAWIDLGGVYLELGLGHEAYQAYESGLRIAEQGGQLLEVAQAQAGLGLAEQLRGQDALAQDHFSQAKTLFEEIGDRDGAQSVEALLGP